MYDIITIGTATRDVFLQSRLFRVFKDPNHLKKIGLPAGEAQCFALGAKIEVDPPILTVGGGAANSAVTFARQGFKAAAIVGIGKDANGKVAVDELKKEKTAAFPVYDKKDMTGYSVILISPNGERTILHYRGASRTVSGTETIFKKIRTRWIYISPGSIPLAAMRKIVLHFKKNKTKIAMNPSKSYLMNKGAKLKNLLKNLDVVIVNREEGAYLTGAEYKDERKIFKKFDELAPGISVMTDGPRGVSVSDGKTVYKAGIFKNKKIVDRTGAGDAFGSGFVAGLIRKNDIKYAIRLGSANATSVVEQIGATAAILRRQEFGSGRWKNLPIKTSALK